MTPSNDGQVLSGESDDAARAQATGETVAQLVVRFAAAMRALREIEAASDGGRRRFVAEGPAVLMLKLEQIYAIARAAVTNIPGA